MAVGSGSVDLGEAPPAGVAALAFGASESVSLSADCVVGAGAIAEASGVAFSASTGDKGESYRINYIIDMDACLVEVDIAQKLPASFSYMLISLAALTYSKSSDKAAIQCLGAQILALYANVSDAVKAALYQNLLTVNALLFDQIKRDKEHGHDVSVACVSRRQTLKLDAVNAFRIDESDPTCVCYSGSAFEVFPYIAETLGVRHDPSLLTDVLGFVVGLPYNPVTYELCVLDSTKPGDYHNKVMGYLAGSRSSDDGTCDAVLATSVYDDTSKVLHILANVYANFDPKDSRTQIYRFFDDSYDVILPKARHFFGTYPEVLPKGVRLELFCHYSASKDGTEEEVLQPFPDGKTYCIVGTGDPANVANYQQFLHALVLRIYHFYHGHGMPVGASSLDVSGFYVLNPAIFAEVWSSAGWRKDSPCSEVATPICSSVIEAAADASAEASAGAGAS